MLYLLDYHHRYNGNILPALSNSCNFTILPSLSPSISRLPESGLFLFRIGLLCLVSVQLTGGICPAHSLRAQWQMVHPAGVLAQPLFSRVIQPWPRKYSRKRNPNGLPALHTMFLTMLMFLFEPLLCWLGHVFRAIVMLEYPSTIHFQCTGWLQCPGGTWPRPSSLWCGAVVLSH